MLAANGRGGVAGHWVTIDRKRGSVSRAMEAAARRGHCSAGGRERALSFPKSVPNDIDARGGRLRGSRARLFGQGGVAVDLSGVPDAPGGIVDQAVPAAIAENRKEKEGARGQVIAVMSL